MEDVVGFRVGPWGQEVGREAGADPAGTLKDLSVAVHA